MEIELSPFGKYPVPLRITDQHQLNAIIFNQTFNARLESRHLAEKRWIANAKQRDLEQLAQQAEDPVPIAKSSGKAPRGKAVKKKKTKSKGKGKANDDDVIMSTDDDEQKEKDYSDISLFDISPISEVIEHMDYTRIEMSYEASLNALMKMGNQQQRGHVEEAPPANTLGEEVARLPIKWFAVGSKGLRDKIRPLLAAVLVEKAMAKAYREEFITQGSGGFMRQELSHLLNPLTMPQIRPGAPSLYEYCWWDRISAPAEIAAKYMGKSKIEHLSVRLNNIMERNNIQRHLQRMIDLVQSTPGLALFNRHQTIPSDVHQCMDLLFKVKYHVLQSLYHC